MRMQDSKLYKLPMDGPHDASGLESLIDSGEIEPTEIQAIMLNHEGDMYAKASATTAYAYMLSKKTGTPLETILRTVPFQGIAGVSGYMTPHATVFVRRWVDGEASGHKRLVMAGGCADPIPPELMGTKDHARAVSKRVQELVHEAGVESPEDVKFVFIKGCWASEADKKDAAGRGKRLVHDDWWTRGAYGRAACAVGGAHALGEIAEEDFESLRLVDDGEKYYTTKVHVSAGEERPTDAIIVLGNANTSVSDTAVECGVLDDGLDVDGMKGILRKMGFAFDCCPSPEQLERIDYAFIKPKASEMPTIRGHRHTIMTDMTLGPFWWITEKAPIHATATTVLGTTVMELATGPEHQGPVGKPLMAVVARV